jgi:hypothetical protein
MIQVRSNCSCFSPNSTLLLKITALNSPLRQLFHYQDCKMLADVVRVASSISDKQSTIGHALTSRGPCVEKWILVATEVGRASQMSSRKFSENPSPHDISTILPCHGCSLESPRGKPNIRNMVYICRGPAQSGPDHPSSSLTTSPFIRLSHRNHDWSRTSNHGHRRILGLLTHSRRVCQKGKGSRSQSRFQTYALPVGHDCTQVSYPLKLQSQTTNAN